MKAYWRLLYFCSNLQNMCRVRTSHIRQSGKSNESECWFYRSAPSFYSVFSIGHDHAWKVFKALSVAGKSIFPETCRLCNDSFNNNCLTSLLFKKVAISCHRSSKAAEGRPFACTTFQARSNLPLIFCVSKDKTNRNLTFVTSVT